MNNSVKSFFFYLEQCFRRRCHFKDFLSRALTSFLLAERNHLCNFGRGQYGVHSCESILYLDKWFRKRCHLREKLAHCGHMADEDQS